MSDAAARRDETMCECGHDNRLHRNDGRASSDWTPCIDKRCDCEAFDPARVPVNDEAEAAWQSIQPAWFGDSETAFEAGFRAARGEDA